jgi:hypothetical protein
MTRERGIPWPIAGVIAGAVGTAAMTLAYKVEHVARPDVEGELDYDDSLVPGQIVASVLRLPSVTERGEQELGTALRWGYGSAFGMMHGLLRRLLGEPRASAVFGGMLMTATSPCSPYSGGRLRRGDGSRTSSPRAWEPTSCTSPA